MALGSVSKSSPHKFSPYTYDVAVVSLVVRAHDTTSTGTDSISKRPDVELVQGDVVDVGRDSIRDVGTSLSEVLLLVENVVLGASNDTSVLNTLDRLGIQDAGENRVRTESFPIATAFRTAAEGTDDRAKHDIYTFVTVLATHVITARVCE